MVEWLKQGHGTVIKYSKGDLSIPGDFSTSSETRASKTSAVEIVIEIRESCTGGRSSMLGNDDE